MMKSKKDIPPEIVRIMNDFVQGLPEASKCFNSTIEDEITLDDKKIKLMAQKKKGTNGLCWNIDYKTILAD
jgi:hypothetical protein